MKIAFTGSIFFNQKIGGISRYYVNLVSQLNLNNVDAKIFAPLNKNLYLKELHKKYKTSNYLSRFPESKILYFINESLSNLCINSSKPDIVHETYYSKNIEKLKGYKKVVTIYDLIHEKFHENYSKSKINEKNNTIKSADHFICISKKTQQDFIKYYNVSIDKTSVVYLGSNHFNINEEKSNENELSNYVLYVGSRKKYKNFQILHNALNQINKNIKLKLICFGGEKIENDEIRKIPSNIHVQQVFGNDNELAKLYKNALCFINTSSYEGFGIPNIEAMYLGCPVLCSDIEVFREICGDSSLYFDPNNPQELAQKIELLIDDKNTSIQLKKKGKAKAQLFTWKNCALDTIDVYDKLVK
tara:strand:+ start:1455 stop:2528 length:1074 start_codon:yes stop_codon:yes gene_type:complete